MSSVSCDVAEHVGYGVVTAVRAGSPLGALQLWVRLSSEEVSVCLYFMTVCSTRQEPEEMMMKVKRKFAPSSSRMKNHHQNVRTSTVGTKAVNVSILITARAQNRCTCPRSTTSFYEGNTMAILPPLGITEPGKISADRDIDPDGIINYHQQVYACIIFTHAYACFRQQVSRRYATRQYIFGCSEMIKLHVILIIISIPPVIRLHEYHADVRPGDSNGGRDGFDSEIGRN